MHRDRLIMLLILWTHSNLVPSLSTVRSKSNRLTWRTISWRAPQIPHPPSKGISTSTSRWPRSPIGSTQRTISKSLTPLPHRLHKPKIRKMIISREIRMLSIALVELMSLNRMRTTLRPSLETIQWTRLPFAWQVRWRRRTWKPTQEWVDFPKRFIFKTLTTCSADNTSTTIQHLLTTRREACMILFIRLKMICWMVR